MMIEQFNPVGYSVQGAAAAIGQKEDTIKKAIAKGDLTPHYPNSKAVILFDDLLEWARTLPIDKPAVRS